MKENYSDKEIITQIRQGGKTQYELAAKRVYDECKFHKGFLMKTFNNDKEVVDDIYNNAIVILIRNIRNGKFKEASTISTYLGGIIRNLTLKEINNRKSKKEIISFQEEYPEAVDIETPDSIYLSREKKQIIEGVITKLQGDCSLVLSLWREGRKFKEIAKEMNFKSEQVARVTKFRCWKKLLKIVDDLNIT